METNLIFYGSDEFSVSVLTHLLSLDITPSTIITLPDAPRGRGLALAPTPAKVFATQLNIPVLEIDAFTPEALEKIRTLTPDIALVASFGKIIPQQVIDIPKHSTLNIHPSLLPRWRGATPLESAIMNDAVTGVSIMQINSKMDQGSILIQQTLDMQFPIRRDLLSEDAATLGAELFARVLPDWIAGTLTPQTQQEEIATYCKPLSKGAAQLLPEDSEETKYRKYLAFFGKPNVFFFAESKGGKRTRVIVTEATFADGKFVMQKVRPESKKEMDFESFTKGYNPEIKA